MLNLATAVEDDTLTGVFGRLAFHLSKEGGELIVIVHRPAVEGMVVALGTLDARTHEDLGDVLGELEDVFFHLEKVGGGIVEGSAFCAKKFDDEFIERHVAGDALAEPFVVVERGFIGDAVAALIDSADLHELGPFHNPHFGEFFAGEQVVDEVIALVGAGVSDEIFPLLQSGREADDIKEGTAEEGFIGGEARWDDTEFVELLGDVGVDVVKGFVFRPLIFQAGGHNDGLGTLGEGVEAT